MITALSSKDGLEGEGVYILIHTFQGDIQKIQIFTCGMCQLPETGASTSTIKPCGGSDSQCVLECGLIEFSSETHKVIRNKNVV